MPLTNRNLNNLNDGISTVIRHINDASNIINTIARAPEIAENIVNNITNSIDNIENNFKNMFSQLSNDTTDKLKEKIKTASKIIKDGDTQSKIVQKISGASLNKTNNLDILASPGKKQENKPQFIYNIIIQFEGENQNYWDDTLLFVVHKFAGVTRAPFYLLRSNISVEVQQQLINDLNDGKNPKCTLFIYTVNTITKKIENLIYKKKMAIVGVIPKQSNNLKEATTTSVDLALINPILFEMSKKYTYNKIFTSKSAYDVLKDYESYITSRYGDIFSSKHYLSNENHYIYNQLVTKPSDQISEIPDRQKIKYKHHNDITFPAFLQSKYKIDNGFGIYFYDDFVLKEKKDIIRYFVSFYDKNKLEKFDVTKYDDIIKQTTFVQSHEFNDKTNIITKNNVVITHKLPNSNYSTTKTQKSNNDSGVSSGNNKIILSDEDRYLLSKDNNEMNKSTSQSGETLNIQSPDNKSGGEKRLQIGVDTILKKIDSIDEYIIYNTSPDWLTFGCLYNLILSKPEEYLYTPISCVHIFHRLHDKDKDLGLVDRCLFVKYKNSNGEKESIESKPIPPIDKNVTPPNQKNKPNQSEVDKKLQKQKQTGLVVHTDNEKGLETRLQNDGSTLHDTKTGEIKYKVTYDEIFAGAKKNNKYGFSPEEMME